MDRKICYIFRKPHTAFHSIEEVFATVIPEVAKHLPVSRVALHFPSGFWGGLKNLVTFRKKKNTLYHITGQDYYMALRTGRNTVLTIHDVGSAFTGKWPRDMIIRLFWFRIPAKLARRITVISEFSKGELSRLVPFAAPKIRVIHNPLNPALEYRPKPINAERPVILLMGTKSNKNLDRIFPALKDIPCHLIIVGKLSDSQLSLLKECDFKENHNSQITNFTLSQAEGHESAIRNPQTPLPPERPVGLATERHFEAMSKMCSQSFGRAQSEIRNPKSEIRNPNTFSSYHSLPYSEIIRLYRACDLLCFASTYEGFGLPILEAQATGRVVVTSTVASMPEVAGEGACLVDPFSVDSIREGVLRVISDAGYREELVRNGLKNIERFRAERLAAEYMGVYRGM